MTGDTGVGVESRRHGSVYCDVQAARISPDGVGLLGGQLARGDNAVANARPSGGDIVKISGSSCVLVLSLATGLLADTVGRKGPMFFISCLSFRTVHPNQGAKLCKMPVSPLSALSSQEGLRHDPRGTFPLNLNLPMFGLRPRLPLSYIPPYPKKSL